MGRSERTEERGEKSRHFSSLCSSILPCFRTFSPSLPSFPCKNRTTCSSEGVWRAARSSGVGVEVGGGKEEDNRGWREAKSVGGGRWESGKARVERRRMIGAGNQCGVLRSWVCSLEAERRDERARARRGGRESELSNLESKKSLREEAGVRKSGRRRRSRRTPQGSQSVRPHPPRLH